jgi:hypothetical protein
MQVRVLSGFARKIYDCTVCNGGSKHERLPIARPVIQIEAIPDPPYLPRMAPPSSRKT